MAGKRPLRLLACSYKRQSAAERPNVYSSGRWKRLFSSGGAQCDSQQRRVFRSSRASKFFGALGSIDIWSLRDQDDTNRKLDRLVASQSQVPKASSAKTTLSARPQTGRM